MNKDRHYRPKHPMITFTIKLNTSKADMTVSVTIRRESLED